MAQMKKESIKILTLNIAIAQLQGSSMINNPVFQGGKIL